jgi:hypothetical protein
MKEEAYLKFCFMLGQHKQFKMRLPHYDDGSHFFWPCYGPSERLFKKGTLVIVRFDRNFKVGTIENKVPESPDSWGINLVPQAEDTKTWLHMIAVKREAIIAVLLPN